MYKLEKNRVQMENDLLLKETSYAKIAIEIYVLFYASPNTTCNVSQNLLIKKRHVGYDSC